MNYLTSLDLWVSGDEGREETVLAEDPDSNPTSAADQGDSLRFSEFPVFLQENMSASTLPEKPGVLNKLKDIKPLENKTYYFLELME